MRARLLWPAAGRFAPQGTRGACPCVRAGSHYIRDWRAYARRQATETGIAVIVETPAGLDDFDGIVAVEGLAAVVIGPFDLSISLGFEGDCRHPQVQEAVLSMVRRAQERGVPVVMPVFSPDPGRAQTQLRSGRISASTPSPSARTRPSSPTSFPDTRRR